MAVTAESILELKNLMLGLDTKVNSFSTKLDTIENKFTNMIKEVQVNVDQVKRDVSVSKREIKELRAEHNELEKGVEHIELELNRVEFKTMDLMKKSMDDKLKQLRVQQVMLEKHERKYNVLVYGLPEESGENIWTVISNLFVKELDIDKGRADRISVANAHRIPTRQFQSRPKSPNPIIIRFIHYADKQLVMSQGYKLAGKRIRIVDDLPPCMKEVRNELASIAYKIRNEEKLKTRIRVVGIDLILETRINVKDKWQLRKKIEPV